MDSTLYVCILIVDNNQDTNIGIQEKQNGATEVPPSTEASVDQSGDVIEGRPFSHSIDHKYISVSLSFTLSIHCQNDLSHTVACLG